MSLDPLEERWWQAYTAGLAAGREPVQCRGDADRAIEDLQKAWPRDRRVYTHEAVKDISDTAAASARDSLHRSLVAQHVKLADCDRDDAHDVLLSLLASPAGPPPAWQPPPRVHCAADVELVRVRRALADLPGPTLEHRAAGLRERLAARAAEVDRAVKSERLRVVGEIVAHLLECAEECNDGSGDMMSAIRGADAHTHAQSVRARWGQP